MDKINQETIDKLPSYQSHVKAAKIRAATPLAGGGYALELGIQEKTPGVLGTVEVDLAWVQKRLPQGRELREGCFVVYKDGYQSWSPVGAFEDGYALFSGEETEPVMDDLHRQLLTLLDRIECEDDHTLASQRHDIVVQAGFTLSIGEPVSGRSDH